MVSSKPIIILMLCITLNAFYRRYLEVYERIFFLGEDTEDTIATRTYAQLLKYRRMFIYHLSFDVYICLFVLFVCLFVCLFCK